MTKKQMIEVIQQKEAELFLQIKIDESLFGMDSTITSRSRSDWAKINGLMEDLGIKPDNSLPENQRAIAFIADKVKKEELN
jgi:hypothetical protein